MEEIRIDKQSVQRILLIKLKGIGDIILSSVVFNSLLQEFPGARIDYLCEPPGAAVLEKLPFINRVLLFRPKDTLGGIRALLEVYRGKYDLVLDFYANPRTALITRLSGARYRAGFPYRGRQYAYNLYGPAERDKYHAAELHARFLTAIGIPLHGMKMHIGIGDEDMQFANHFYHKHFMENASVVVISPSGGWQSKKAEPEVFSRIATALHAVYNISFLVVWGPGDKADAETIHRQLAGYSVLAPPSTFRQMCALMKLGKCVIANDSGPMHAAAALDIPVLALYGPTNPRLQGPFGNRHEWVRHDTLDCIGCNLLDCPRNHECFLELPSDPVVAAFNRLVAKNSIAV